ncbi:MAG TPA: hypothetical protein VKB45_05400, partial [Gemmatimonadales bacterium]|nr:hypothetical protein [Gemmatimonadales bacterium]
MTDVPPSASTTPPRRATIAETVAASDSFLRHAGREFLVVFYAALRSLKLYPIENAQVQKALDDLASVAKPVLNVEQELGLRLALENYASFSHVLQVMRHCGVGAIRLDAQVDRRQLQILVSLLLAHSAGESSPDTIHEIIGKLSEAGATHITVEPPFETDETVADTEKAKEAAK